MNHIDTLCDEVYSAAVSVEHAREGLSAVLLTYESWHLQCELTGYVTPSPDTRAVRIYRGFDADATGVIGRENLDNYRLVRDKLIQASDIVALVETRTRRLQKPEILVAGEDTMLDGVKKGLAASKTTATELIGYTTTAKDCVGDVRKHVGLYLPTHQVRGLPGEQVLGKIAHLSPHKTGIPHHRMNLDIADNLRFCSVALGSLRLSFEGLVEVVADLDDEIRPL